MWDFCLTSPAQYWRRTPFYLLALACSCDPAGLGMLQIWQAISSGAASRPAWAAPALAQIATVIRQMHFATIALFTEVSACRLRMARTTFGISPLNTQLTGAISKFRRRTVFPALPTKVALPHPRLLRRKVDAPASHFWAAVVSPSKGSGGRPIFTSWVFLPSIFHPVYGCMATFSMRTITAPDLLLRLLTPTKPMSGMSRRGSGAPGRRLALR